MKLRTIAYTFYLICDLAFANTVGGLPDLGDPSLLAMSNKDMHQLVLNFNRTIALSPKVLHDGLVNDYIQYLGTRLVEQSPEPEQPFHFFMVITPEINAFAGPGGFVGINSGLLLASHNESELAAVMAHEIAHVTQHHILRSLADEKNMRLPTLLGLLTAAALGVVSPNLAEGAMMMGMAGVAQHRINFTRGEEQEADQIGIDMLHLAGFDPYAMARFFQRLQQQERYYDRANIPAILLDHPVTQNRIADANNRAAQWHGGHNQDETEYRLMQTRVQVLTTEDLSATLQLFQNKVHLQPDDNAAQYGLALAELQNHQYQTARTEAESLMQRVPDQIAFRLLLADTYLQLNQYNDAIPILNSLYLDYPDNITVQTNYGEALLHAGKAKQAVTVLQQALQDYPKLVEVYELLSRGQAAAGNQASAYFTRARALMLLEDEHSAKRELNHAAQLAKHDPYLTAQIKALQNTIQKH